MTTAPQPPPPSPNSEPTRKMTASRVSSTNDAIIINLFLIAGWRNTNLPEFSSSKSKQEIGSKQIHSFCNFCG